MATGIEMFSGRKGIRRYFTEGYPSQRPYFDAALARGWSATSSTVSAVSVPQTGRRG